MKNLKKGMPLLVAACLLLAGQLLWAGGGGEQPAAAPATAKAGGVLRYAVIGSPPTLDQHVVTSDLNTLIAQHWAEGLYTFNAKYEPVPMLATGEEYTDQG